MKTSIHLKAPANAPVVPRSGAGAALPDGALPTSSPQSAPLSLILGPCADAVAAVRAGRSPGDALTQCPQPLRSAAQALSFTVLRHLGAALTLRERLVKKPPPPVQDALLLTALALLWPQGEDSPYPAHTLVNQAVQAARQRSKAKAPFPDFLNAVLRRFLREEARLRVSLTDLPEQHPARTQHPQWWTQTLMKDWPEHWQALLAVNHQRAPMTLRVNTRRGDAVQAMTQYQARLQAVGLKAHPVGPQALMLETPCPVERLPGFAQGDVSVQDAAAQRAAPLLLFGGPEGLALRPGARVLDACAAPGGKTVHLLELADVDVWAIDQDAARLGRVRENLERSGVQAKVLAADAASTAVWWDGQPFDAILLDAPCSASGIVRRHPDVRWLRRETDIAQLAVQQARLLDALWPLLAPGGRLLYCTCSVFKAEGEDQVAAFLQRLGSNNRAIRLSAPGHLLPSAELPESASPGGLVAEDGFFYALLQKPLPS
jgi:16S rRNA (cytosine967-C5)-methyltransferase